MAERGGVRLRTTVAAVVVVGLALLATSLEMVAFVERSLVAQVADEAALRAEEVADAGGEGPGPLDVADATEQFVQVVRGGRVVGASVNVAGFAPLALPREEQQITLDTVPFASGAFVVVSVTSRDGDVVVVGRSIDDVADARHVVGLALLFGGTTLLLVIGAVTWLIVGRALRPVEDIRLEV